MKIVAIVQARLGSTRLPGKVLRPLNKRPMIEILLDRLKIAVKIDEVVVATTDTATDDQLVEFLDARQISVFRGSESDVLSRYHEAAMAYDADIVVRITGDCPLIDYDLVDQIVVQYINSDLDYLSNTLTPTYPDGLDIEVFSFASLAKAHNEAKSDYEREHVTPFIKFSGHFNVQNYENEQDLSNLRWTVDELDDLISVERILDLFNGELRFNWLDVIKHPNFENVEMKNCHIVRDEGAKMSKGQKLWKRAKRAIPGGNMLLSKRPEMFLPDLWPSYFSKASGCSIWDLDGRQYTDVSIMGIGTNLLGYGVASVDNAVLRCVQDGNMSTLNAPEEVLLAERLVEMHPWSDMVRFARSGGEANAIALRIARAASGKSGVAICGYHGWHDWYLATNLQNNAGLTTHLLPGLEPAGVPDELANTVHSFEYNDIETLQTIISEKQIGVVVMEVMRNYPPQNDFLNKVRRLCDDNGIVLVFDECTSGFRETFGGLHLKYKVNPDIAMFGKALGNGYAVTAVVGKREVMEYAQSSFISSTFWTERIGSVAALATLEVMEKEKSWETITSIGQSVKYKWSELAEVTGLDIVHAGIPALASFNFTEYPLEKKTFFIQEMLGRGYIASNSLYASLAHTDDILNSYFSDCGEVFEQISKFHTKEEIITHLRGGICHDGFRRLN